jgi:hypothetical protein
MPAQYDLQPNRGQSRSPHVPGSWPSPLGRARGARFPAADLRARSRARRSAAACLRLAACRSLVAFRLADCLTLTAFRFCCRPLVASWRWRALKSDFGAQVCRRPRVLRHAGHSHVTGFCTR